MNPILSNSDQGAATLKLDSWGFKEFGSGDGPPPPVPRVLPILNTICGSDRTTLFLQDKSQSHAVQSQALKKFQDAEICPTGSVQLSKLVGNHKPCVPQSKHLISLLFKIVCCSHDQVSTGILPGFGINEGQHKYKNAA